MHKSLRSTPAGCCAAFCVSGNLGIVNVRKKKKARIENRNKNENEDKDEI